MLAEYVKSQRIQLSSTMRCFLEYGIPCFSLSCLLGVTIYVSVCAVQIISHPTETESVNVYFLYGFASGNIFVDIVCGVLFYYRGNIYSTIISSPQLSNESIANDTNTRSENNDIVDICLEDDNNNKTTTDQSTTSETLPKRKIMNMMCALTFVAGDSIRTISIFVAATVSVAGNINADICDAWAAILVSITILIMIVNILYEMYKFYLAICSDATTSMWTILSTTDSAMSV